MGYKKMKYAPVVIPTLNRIEHLQRCITSLQRNPWAKYTPLIISVDYPPSEKYQDGYQKVCSYLKEDITGFASVKIIYQKENLGPYENAEFLRKYIGSNYDRYIFLEDDIETSPNFIEYIDKGLDIFEENDDIIAICAGAPVCPESETDNVVLTPDFAAYGYGTWIIKENYYYERINRSYLLQLVKHTESLIKLAKYSPSLLFALQEAILCRHKLYQLPNGEVPVIDMTIKIYAVVDDKYVIAACHKKVRNWGFDGSGENSPKVKNLEKGNGGNDKRDYFDYKFSNPIHIYQVPERKNLELIIRSIVAIMRLKAWGLTHREDQV